MLTTVKYLANTPTLENAIHRTTNQFILDNDFVISTQILGYGKFLIRTITHKHMYEWSHVLGTKLISSVGISNS